MRGGTVPGLRAQEVGGVRVEAAPRQGVHGERGRGRHSLQKLDSEEETEQGVGDEEEGLVLLQSPRAGRWGRWRGAQSRASPTPGFFR